MALQHRLGERWGMAVELMWSDDGIVIRLPESIDELPDDDLLIDPDEIEELIVSQLPSTSMFASRFRERSEEHTSELQSLMRISYAVFCLKKKKHKQQHKEH